MTIAVRPATEADCRAMAAFRRRMEGGAFLEELRDEAYYRHKFLEFGFAVVAAGREGIVGVTAATPKRVRLPGGVVSAAELGDLFVAPDRRGQGLFRALHDAVLEELCRRGVRLVTVRAGRGASDHLERAFGYRRLFRVAESLGAVQAEGLRDLPLGRVPLLRRLLPRIRMIQREVTGAKVRLAAPEELPPEARNDRIGTVRDAERLRWRYAADPSPYRAVVLECDGRPAGAAVTLCSGGKGFLVDLWVDTESAPAADLLVSRSLRTLAEGGAGVVHFWRAATHGPRRDPAAAAVRRFGLRTLRRRKGVFVRTLGDVVLPPPGDWFFRMGDTDGI